MYSDQIQQLPSGSRLLDIPEPENDKNPTELLLLPAAAARRRRTQVRICVWSRRSCQFSRDGFASDLYCCGRQVFSRIPQCRQGTAKLLEKRSRCPCILPQVGGHKLRTSGTPLIRTALASGCEPDSPAMPETSIVRSRWP
jgi:hypothetical protein